MRSWKAGPDRRIALSLVFFLYVLGAPTSLAEWQSSNIGSSSAVSLRSYLNDVASEGVYCWPKEKLPLKVFFQPSFSVPGYRNSYPKILAGCFDEWVQASQGKLGWVQTNNLQEADIVCRWTDEVRKQTEGTEAGRTRTFATLNTLTNRGVIHRGEMILLTRLPEREFSDAEVKKSYLHEVGHALGIAGHSPNRRDIMYFAVSNTQNSQLSAQDTATINQLYNDYPYLVTQSRDR